MNSAFLGRARRARTLFLAVVCTASMAGAAAAHQPADTTLIVNAVLIDGTGAPRRPAAVRLRGDRIVEVGTLTAAAGEAVVDATRLVLAPGFIDTHSHGDHGIFDHADALAATSQGISTIVVGQDGGSPWPLSEFFGKLEKTPAAVNVASYAGHGRLRRKVMRDDFRRRAKPEELARMKELLADELKAGALGLSTGLEYDPGIFSEELEVVELARQTAQAGGRYISHVRSEDRYFWKAIDEIIAIGREARIPVQVSHLKLAMRSLWGQADKLIRTFDEARAAGVDITADIYPYLYWQSTLTVLFPDRNFENRQTAEVVLREISAPEDLLMGTFAPEPSYAGKTLAEIAKLRGTDGPTTLMALIREALDYEKRTGKDAESVIGTSMSEADVEKLMAWPHATICTDGELDGRHPRGFGTYPRVLGRYVRERKIMTLEDAVRKMSSLAAANVGLRERGTIRPGAFADLVLFDPATVIDRATTQDPQALSVGIGKVWVNGALVFDAGAATGKRSGRVLRREPRKLVHVHEGRGDEQRRIELRRRVEGHAQRQLDRLVAERRGVELQLGQPAQHLGRDRLVVLRERRVARLPDALEQLGRGPDPVHDQLPHPVGLAGLLRLRAAAPRTAPRGRLGAHDLSRRGLQAAHERAVRGQRVASRQPAAQPEERGEHGGGRRATPERLRGPLQRSSGVRGAAARLERRRVTAFISGPRRLRIDGDTADAGQEGQHAQEAFRQQRAGGVDGRVGVVGVLRRDVERGGDQYARLARRLVRNPLDRGLMDAEPQPVEELDRPLAVPRAQGQAGNDELHGGRDVAFLPGGEDAGRAEKRPRLAQGGSQRAFFGHRSTSARLWRDCVKGTTISEDERGGA